MGNNPLKYTDPTGKLVQGIAIGATAGAAALVILAILECSKLCDSDTVCPYPRNSGDPNTDSNRNAWVANCKLNCVRSFGELAKGGPW